MNRLVYLFMTLVVLGIGCGTEKEPATEADPIVPETPEKIKTPKSFNAYWFKDGAEISSYKLEQARYGEIHSGTAVMVFVTEPFSRSKQVKLDNYQEAGDDRVQILKLNLTKKFITGIYPYSMMMSTFTPLDSADVIKVTTSSQEWCGHTFFQLNSLGRGNYRYQGYSYFESEGDVLSEIAAPMLEDELWTRIRTSPEDLPVGEFTLLPGSFYLRLRHQPVVPVKATAKLEEARFSEFWPEPQKIYTLNYGESRQLKIYFEPELPYRIVGWEETYLSGFGNAEMLTTRGTLINTIRSKYWGQNSNADRELRNQLGLKMD